MKPGVIYIGQFENNQTDISYNSLLGRNNNDLESCTVYVRIKDMVNLIDDSATATEYDLEMADSPLRISVIDNNEDKFTPIRSKQAEINIHTGNGINIETFADSADLQWLVEVSILDSSDVEVTIFKGWLVLDELTQDFLPDPNTLTLVATDSLALLQDIPLTDFYGVTPTGKYKIIEYLAFCLSKTGLELPINVVYNIRQEDHDTEHLFDVMYLDALTFEDEIGTCEDCYTVIEKILAQEAVLFQHNAEWWILRPDEVRPSSYTSDSYVYKVAKFDYLGIFDDFYNEEKFKSIGDGERMSWMDDDQIISITRPLKEAKLIWNYELPKEIICNYQFQRGSLIYDTPTEKRYLPECWYLQKDVPPSTNDSSYYIKVLYDGNGYETERYMHLPVAAANDDYYLINKKKIPISVTDKFKFSLGFRYSTDLGGGSGHFTLSQAQIRLYADDGTYYTLYAHSGINIADERVYWESCNSSFTTNQHYIAFEGESEDIEFTEWQSVSIESAPVPKSGKLEILLVNAQTASSQTKDFNDLSFEYLAYINGAYVTYKGEYDKVTQLTNPDYYKGVREETIYINQSTKKLFKGALFKLTGSTNVYSGTADFGSTNTIEISGDVTYLFEVGVRYTNLGSSFNTMTFTVIDLNYSIVGNLTIITVSEDTTLETGASVTIAEFDYELAENFWNYCTTPSTPSTFETFGKVRAYSVWNQYKYGLRVFEGTIDQFDTGEFSEGLNVYHSELADCLHMYLMTDANESTNYRVFMMISNEKDHHVNSMGCVFVETFNQYGRGYTDTYEFKYIS